MSEELTLPRGWLRTTLGEVLHIVRGVTYDKLESSKEPGDGRIPILRATNIGERLDFDDLVYVPPKCVSDEQMLRRGDIVIAASSGSISVVGKAARLTDEWHGSFGAFCMGLRVNADIDSAYVAYFLCTSEYRRGVSQLAAGSNINNLRRTHIESFSFPLAPLPEQRRIVAKIEELFSDLDAGVAALERVRANLKRYRAAVLKAAVEGRLTEEWRTRHPATEPAAKLLDRILAERRAKWEQDQLRKFKEAGKTPPKGWKERYEPAPVANTPEMHDLINGWCWASVEQLGDPGEQPVMTGPFGSTLGRGDFIDSGVPLLTIGCLTEGGIKLDKAFYISEKKATQLDRYRVREGDLLFSRSASVGRAGLVTSALMGSVINYHLMRLRLATTVVNPVYFIYFVRGASEVYRYLRRVNHGATRDGINTDDLLAMPVALPPLAEQAEIVAEVDRRLSVADAAEMQVEHALQRAARLRQSILKRAFEGKLVPQDPTAEPAAALLQRIKAGANGHGATVIRNRDSGAAKPAPPTKRRGRAHA